MDDFAKSAFLWAERILDEQEKNGICLAILSVIEPREGNRKLILRPEDVIEIFLPFKETFDGFAWIYREEIPPYERKATIGGYWFFPIDKVAARKQLIRCLLSHSAL